MYWLLHDIQGYPEQNQAISILVTSVKRHDLTLSIPLFLFPFSSPSLASAPWPGNTHMECLEPLVTNQQQIKKFAYTVHVSIFSEPKVLWAGAAKLQICTKANQQRASAKNKIKLG